MNFILILKYRREPKWLCRQTDRAESYDSHVRQRFEIIKNHKKRKSVLLREADFIWMEE